MPIAQEAENLCGCRPWNIPSEDGSSMCWVVGSVCFHQVFPLLEFSDVHNSMHFLGHGKDQKQKA